MKISYYLKYFFYFLLAFLLGAQNTYAKTELIYPIKSISFSIEKEQSFKSLEKEVQPNLGFLKEKRKFGLSEGISAHNHCNYTEWNSYEVANAGGGLIKRLDELNLSVLTKRLDDLEDAIKTKFLDDFADASDDALVAFNKRPELVDYWKANKPKYKLPYTAPKDLEIDDVLKGIDNSMERELIKEVQGIDSPLKDGSFCVSGGFHSELSDIDNIIKYNLPKMDGVKNARKYSDYVDGLEIEIRNSVRYMDIIREDFKVGGKLYKRLLNVDESVVRKISGAGKSGIHAEVQVYNEHRDHLR